MQTTSKRTNTGQSVVQFSNPSQAKRPRRNQTTKHLNHKDASFYSNASNSDDSGIREDYSVLSSASHEESLEHSTLNVSLCKTICLFVEEHLKELAARQKAINKARSSLIRNQQTRNSHQQNKIDTLNFIAHNDISKLKVRDEQTKAIETIKKLTNYLKELSHLISQCESTSNSANFINEDTINKLLETRTNTIQALNDFVLTNHDIDIPIIDSEDLKNYDLCTDLSVELYSSSNLGETGSSSDQNTVEKSIRKYSVKNDSPYIIINDHDHLNPSQRDELYHLNQSTVIATSSDNIQTLERQRREIQKLERDTIELRKLFSDFYDLVKQQSEQVDTIEDNIVIATHRVSEGQHNLNKAMRSLTILVPVAGCITGAVIGGPLGLLIAGKTLGGLTIGCATSLLGLLSSYTAHKKITSTRVKNDI